MKREELEARGIYPDWEVVYFSERWNQTKNTVFYSQLRAYQYANDKVMGTLTEDADTNEARIYHKGTLVKIVR